MNVEDASPGVHACEECGYDLAGLPATDGRLCCPECGGENPPEPRPKRRTVQTELIVFLVVDLLTFAAFGIWWALIILVVLLAFWTLVRLTYPARKRRAHIRESHGRRG